MNSVMRRASLAPQPRPKRITRHKKYAFEELVAELSSAFSCASLGIVPTVRHADYIGAWLDVMREDNRAVVRAASQARQGRGLFARFVPESVAMRRRIRLLAIGKAA